MEQLTYQMEGLSETAGLDAQVLLAHILDCSRSAVIAHPERRLTPDQERRLEAAVRRLKQGEPLPYVLGQWEFYGLEFEVSPAALIPRPETEHLVESGLAWLKSHPGPRLAVDVGTGTGCIAVALAANHPEVRVIASDISWPAIRLADRNIARYSLESRVTCVQADLLPVISRRYDMICANLPYIPSAKLARLPVARREPWLALDGGADGLDLIRRLLVQAASHLVAEGIMLLEIEAGQGQSAARLAESTFPGSQVSVVRDLAGRDRLVCVQNGPTNIHMIQGRE